MNILFRADSSSTIGTGHIMRDLVLAKQYKNSNITFATQNLDGNINHKIIEAGYSIEILKFNNIKELDKLIKKLEIDMIVIDHYDIDEKQEKQLSILNSQLSIMVLDDTYKKHYCDILLNHNISANKKRYTNLVPKDCDIRCGTKYTLLRDEFIKEKNKIYKPNKNKTFFIAMGGADHSNVNVSVLKVLKQFKNIKVNLVTTTANQNLKQLEKYCGDKKWVNLHINSNKIAKLMRKSDFAIVTPSVTSNEVYFMGLPFIAIKTADNQKDIYNYLKKKNYNIVSKFNSSKLSFKIDLILNKIKLKNFTDLSIDESKQVLKMRNHKSVRKWMYSNNIISFKDHFNYLKSLKNQKDKNYFLVVKDIKHLGVVDFTNINNKKAELGIYSNPTLKGQGSILMKTILGYGFKILNLKTIKANVLKNNIKAINLYKKFNFKVIKITDDLLYMELEKDNYV